MVILYGKIFDFAHAKIKNHRLKNLEPSRSETNSTCPVIPNPSAEEGGPGHDASVAISATDSASSGWPVEAAARVLVDVRHFAPQW